MRLTIASGTIAAEAGMGARVPAKRCASNAHYGLVGLGAFHAQNQFGDPNATALSEASEEYGLPQRQVTLTFTHKI